MAVDHMSNLSPYDRFLNLGQNSVAAVSKVPKAFKNRSLFGCSILVVLSGCSAGEPLVEPSGPIFALNAQQNPTAQPVASTVVATKTVVQTQRQTATGVSSKPVSLAAFTTTTTTTQKLKKLGPTIYVATIPLVAAPPGQPFQAPVEATPAVPIARQHPVPAYVYVAPPPAQPIWILNAGTLIGHDLSMWAIQAGWTVKWQSKQDWAVPASSTFVGSFQDVASRVLKTMASQGADIRGKFYAGNHVLYVDQPGVEDAQ